MRPALLQRALAVGATALFSMAAFAVSVGQPAPGFEVKDATGKTVRLADFKGRPVVLEWTNPGCPFVRKHYDSQNMQALQKEYTAKSVVWLSISSTAKDSSEYLEPGALAGKLKAWGSGPSAVLMDDDGTIGKTYGARTTPHMYVIDARGTLVYAGGVDDRRSTRIEDVKGARNFVRSALDETLAGKPVTTATAPAYGCSVKYQD